MTIRDHHQIAPSNLLKSIYATPLNVHKNGLGLTLDLSYITDKLIVCSYPVTKYPKLMYRNSLKDLVTFLNNYHGPSGWKIYDFKVEKGRSDYGDEELMEIVNAHRSCYISLDSDGSTLAAEPVHFVNRVGWMDHSPPPFHIMQEIIDDIQDQSIKSESSVAVLHCKMGKGRSGTICIAYLMKYLDSPLSESREIFMNGRFKPGVSRGVTILSQLRWLRYHEMFLYYEPEFRKSILDQLLMAKFRVHTIQLNEPSSILFSRPCSACIKVQTYNESRNSLKDFATLETDAESLSSSNDNRTITLCFPLELHVSDIRLEFGISARSPHVINTFTSLASYAHCWLNLYWETLKCSTIDSRDHYMLFNLLHEQDTGQDFDFVIKWSELDGTGGTSNRGLKLFESMTLKWSLIE